MLPEDEKTSNVNELFSALKKSQKSVKLM